VVFIPKRRASLALGVGGMIEPFRVDGKISLVTGGSRGIGLGIVRALAEAGSDIAMVARDPSRLETARVEIAAKGRRVWIYPFDLRRSAEAPELFNRIVAETGGVDILVNNAGGIVRGMADAVRLQAVHDLMELNLAAVFALCQEFARERIRSAKPGKIINIASVMSETVRPGAAAYAMTKGGIRQLTKALAVEWAPHGIHVNAIGPGFTRTELTEALWSNREFEEAVNRRTPLGRWGTAADIGHAAVFLASPASDFITGQTLYVDGGLISSMGGLG
jgi:gluconate 5-dehydrogenase